MQSVPLANTGKTTSRLGFGCARLGMGSSRKHSLALLEHAFDCGIRHFDVAPIYGNGDAERCLGEFARKHRSQITITTKFGIKRSSSTWFRKGARRFLKVVRKYGPDFLSTAAKVTIGTVGTAPDTLFTVEEANSSLEASLRFLKTDYVDLLLLHEATAEKLDDDQLLDFLTRLVASGKIGGFGVGSDRKQIPGLVKQCPNYCQVIQHQWSLFDTLPEQSTRFQIRHGVIDRALQSFHINLKEEAERIAKISMLLDYDISDFSNLTHLAFKSFLITNPNHVLLFSSSDIGHISHNCGAADNVSLEEPAKRLYALVRQGIETPQCLQSS